MQRTWLWLAILGLLPIDHGRGTEEPEELPPPTSTKSVLASPPATDSLAGADADSTGWALDGPLGRHYFFGTQAIADYVRAGRRSIVQLEQEAPRNDAQADPHFLYYRESATGHRWAIARHPRPAGRYRVFFQAADAPGSWLLYQFAEGSFSLTELGEESPAVIVIEPTCGR